MRVLGALLVKMGRTTCWLCHATGRRQASLGTIVPRMPTSRTYGITSIKRARTWVKLRVPCLLLPSGLDAQFGTPYPRSDGFDTDIGAFIESSSMSSPLGLMAPTIIDSDVVQGETFLPGQIFVLGGFALQANSLRHLEQMESYAPGHLVRFGSLNYTTDIRGDLIFDGFEPLPCAPRGHDEYDLALPSDSVQKITPAAAQIGRAHV